MKNFFIQILKRIKKFDDYTNQYLKASNKIDIPSLAYTNWGVYFANLKDFNSAIEKLETAVLMNDNNPKPCISLGIIYAKTKQTGKAEAVLKEAIKRDSQNSYAYSVLSSILISEDKFDEAEDALRKALKLSPNDYEVYLNYGILYAKTKKKDKAIEMLRRAKFLNHSNPHIYFLLGVMLFETDKISEAFSEFKELEAIEKGYKNLNYYLALCYKKEQNYNAVLEYAQRAMEETPNNPSIYILLAQNYITNNKFEEANNVYISAINNGIDDYELYLTWGISLYRENKINEAKEKLYKALEKHENDSETSYRLGLCYVKENDCTMAEKMFRDAIGENEKNSDAISELGILLYNKKEYENAINILFNAINISVEKTYLYFYIANCYFKSGRLKKSLEYYAKTIEYYPNHIEALINYTLNLLYLNSYREAYRKIRNAYQINRTSKKVILLYALVSFKSGMYREAIDKTDELLNLYPDNKDAKIIKAHSYINLNMPNEANDVLNTLTEEEKNEPIYTYLSYLSYKILVDISPSNYNENMLNTYSEKINQFQEIGNNFEEIGIYIKDTLNINKG